MAIEFPNIDPVAIDLGVLQIRWYALAYIAGLVGGLFWANRLGKQLNLNFTKKDWDNFLTYAVLGIIIGGRLGYVIFYKPSFYMANPIDILKIWQGGMAFHGGFLGIVMAVFLFCRRHNKPLWRTADIIAACAPIGLFFGRLSNFVNGELYGRYTDVSWGVIFPGQNLPRHPSQLYEAFLEGLILFIILNIIIKRTKLGITVAGFFIGYGIFRFVVEFTRAPDSYLGLTAGLSAGQWYCMPMILAGAIIAAKRRAA